MPFGKGLALVRDVCVGVEVVDEERLDVVVRLLALVGLAAVGHQMVAIAYLDPLVGLRVPATMPRRSCVLMRHSSLAFGGGRDRGGRVR